MTLIVDDRATKTIKSNGPSVYTLSMDLMEFLFVNLNEFLSCEQFICKWFNHPLNQAQIWWRALTIFQSEHR